MRKLKDLEGIDYLLKEILAEICRAGQGKSSIKANMRHHPY
jgi:hypothetical protein